MTGTTSGGPVVEEIVIEPVYVPGPFNAAGLMPIATLAGFPGDACPVGAGIENKLELDATE